MRAPISIGEPGWYREQSSSLWDGLFCCDMQKLILQPGIEDFDELLVLARQEGYGIEITAFAYPHVLDDASLRERLISEYREKLAEFGSPLSMHGPFFDLIPHSPDARVRAVAYERIEDALQIASQLGCGYVVFHTGYNALIKNPGYADRFLDAQSRFWSEMLDRFPDVTVLLENLWEPEPRLFRRLLDMVASPRLKVCLDTGHAHLFSSVPLEVWFEVLGDDLAYVHVNDNRGDYDAELPPGQGDIDWGSVSAAIRRLKLEPFVAFEVNSLTATKVAIDYFKLHGLYPFDEEVRDVQTRR